MLLIDSNMWTYNPTIYYVLKEVENKKKLCIPLLVGDTKMPPYYTFPADIRPIAFRQAINIPTDPTLLRKTIANINDLIHIQLHTFSARILFLIDALCELDSQGSKMKYRPIEE
jgi:hypothetical protein